MSTQWPQARRAGMRFLLRHRRAIVLALLAIAGLNLVSPLIGRTAHTRVVIIAGKAIPAGALITQSDVATRTWPSAIVPADWPDSARVVVGRRAGVAVGVGDPITGRTLLARTDAALGGGRVLTPVRVADAATLALISPGDTIDVIAAWPAGTAGPATATTVAAGVRVVSVPAPVKGTTYTTEGGLVVLAVPPATAVRIAAAAVSARISLTLQPR